jgi:hypothetical protein
MPVKETPITNAWMSLGFKKAMNEEELERQKQIASHYDSHPLDVPRMQLEHIYRQISLLNYFIQDSEARKTPGGFQTYTIQLNLLGSTAIGAGALDQILPANRSRNEMAIVAGNAPCFISHRNLQTLPAIGTLLTAEYAEIPMGVRWPLATTEPLYAVSASAVTNTVLTIVETSFRTPLKLKQGFKVAREEERHTVNHSNWLEDLIDSA